MTHDGGKSLPSAIFFNYDQAGVSFGHDAIAAYLDGDEGRILWAPKNVIGTNIMKDRTRINNRMIGFDRIIGMILSHLKARAQAAVGHEINKVVLGRPVRFNDYDDVLNDRGELFLKSAAKAAGFKQVEMEFEPIAAARNYEHKIGSEKIALVMDIGGGTSDFSVIRLAPGRRHEARRKSDILAVGGVHVAGTNLDAELSIDQVMPLLGMSGKYTSHEGKVIKVPTGAHFDLAQWHRIPLAYRGEVRDRYAVMAALSDSRIELEKLLSIIDNDTGHQLCRKVEQLKINICNTDSGRLDFNTMMSNTRYLELEKIIIREKKRALAKLDMDARRVKLNNTAPAYKRQERQITETARERIEDLEGLKDNTKTVAFSLTHTQLEEITQGSIDKIFTRTMEVVKDAGLHSKDIGAVFLTGGSSLMPIIQKRTEAMFPGGEVVFGDAFASVGLGLTLAARTVFG